MRKAQRFALIGLLGLSLGVSIIALRWWTQPFQFDVEIRRTSYGIPHIEASNEKNLGYGVGYSYAEDNLCLLANEVVTVNGERSKYFGVQALTDETIDNLTNDFFFQWFNSDKRVSAFISAQKPEIRDLLKGYAAGYNRYLQKVGTLLPQACRNQAWVREITERDLVKLIRRLTALRGVELYKAAVITAQPPKSDTPIKLNLDEHTRGHLDIPAQQTEPEHTFGSNALAIGRALTDNGRSMLLGNPHFPWSGASRFYEMHLTIPGKLDVMGAALPGMPVINIGFSHDVAWSHTVDTSDHFTIYHLQLDPADSAKYIVDGKSLPMRKTVVDVEIRQSDGSIEHRTHDIYETEFGPIIASNQLRWSTSEAFALQDANFDNSRALEQWYSMDSAKTLTDFRATIEKKLGIPWVNTIAAGSDGNVIYMNVSAIPHIDKLELAQCSMNGRNHASTAKPVILDGSRAKCDWKRGHAGGEFGLFAGEALPVLLRDDYVQNSNGSAWLTNPATPLVNFSPLVSQESIELNGRTRFAVNWLDERAKAASKPGGPPIRAQDLEDLVMGDQVYLASLVMDDVSRLCHSMPAAPTSSEQPHELNPICSALDSWDRTAKDTASIGYVYFERFMQRALQIPKVWAFPFNAAAPLSTPKGLNLIDPVVANALRAAMLAAQGDIGRLGISANVNWGRIQVSVKDSRNIPIPGGDGSLGIYNAIQSSPFENGRRVVRAGSSYIQVVSFTDNGPVANALLTFSESSDPASAHYSDQTELFSRSQWVPLPFSKASILDDPSYKLICLQQR